MLKITETPLKKIEASCLILAGGQGKRLTPDKPLLKIEGQAIIERTAGVVVPLFEEVLIVTNSPEKYKFLALPLVADERQGCGPLMGIYSGLQRVKHDAAFVCAADMPFLNEEVIRAEFAELGAFDIVVPWPQGRPEFLHAFYHKRCLPAIREILEANLLKIERLTRHCRIRRLHRDWFKQQGLTEGMDLAFTNINTMEDYHRWLGQGPNNQDPLQTEIVSPPKGRFDEEALQSLVPEVLEEIRRTLIEQETAYQRPSDEQTFSSLWAHSSRVGRIAQRIAEAEGLDPEPSLLAGLLHDTGKFVDGNYHEDDIPEEEKAVEFVERILSGTVYAKWIPVITQAILTMYLEPEVTSDIGRVVYDADCLDKLGCLGVAQFFAKNTLRRRFMDEDLIVRASIELTYSHHAPDTLKTETGRSLALSRKGRTRRFYLDLLEEWTQLGLGAFQLREEDIAGISCLLVVPVACSCGGRLKLDSDIQDAIKCRSLVMKYACEACGLERDYSFCLPNVKDLPRRKGDMRV
jgi:molybdopterin-guanine dinucleotide biosynthesis protein A/HD superfamily phosphodiesterase